MGRNCSACQSPLRAEIDRQIAGGMGYRTIAARFGLSPQAVRRHRTHLPTRVLEERKVEEQRHRIDIEESLRAAYGATASVLRRAHEGGESDLTLRAVDRLLRVIELAARLQGDLDLPHTPIALVMQPEWIALRGRLLVALEAFPAAKIAVAQALEAADE